MANNKQDFNQFGSAKPAHSGDPQHCAQCEAMLMDALDDTLSAQDQATFDLHLIGCPTCSSMVADAQRGAAWLEMLKTPRPEPSAALLDRILAQTSGQLSAQTQSQTEVGNASPVPFLVSSNTLLGRPTASMQVGITQLSPNVLPFRSRVASSFSLRTIGHNLLQPRLAMTAAMAFFSVALTLSLTGIKISDLRASDLRPASLKRSISEANAHVVRYYDNLRVVYELESRVHDLQRSSDSGSATPAAPVDSNTTPSQDQPNHSPNQKQDQDQQSRPRPRPGTSRRESPIYPGAQLQLVAADSHSKTSLFNASPVVATLVSLSPGIIPCNTDSKVQEGTLV